MKIKVYEWPDEDFTDDLMPIFFHLSPASVEQCYFMSFNMKGEKREHLYIQTHVHM